MQYQHVKRTKIDGEEIPDFQDSYFMFLLIHGTLRIQVSLNILLPLCFCRFGPSTKSVVLPYHFSP